MELHFGARVLVGGAASAVLSLSNLGVLGPAGAAAGVALVAAAGTDVTPATASEPVAAQVPAPPPAVVGVRRLPHRARVRSHVRQGWLTG